ncbi:hypothetical protein CYMTET_10201 [Cymbomonas tetramitiformis]|uniref:N-acetyltransferase domain-containing protein n=1 Tax=Cymbomonas tetramitiformis TaxID=36881 RepID=A0AAE0GQ37_9CHLO|nr:hypothetical protein CYMTET_10201 [Cymbomonas tetramitiformis]
MDPHSQGLPSNLRIERVATSSLSSHIITAVQALHDECFKGEAPKDKQESAREFLDRVLACHDEGSCVWFLLWLSNTLVGMCTVTPYTRSLYGWNLAVSIAHRKRGYGRLLMHHAQEYAYQRGLGELSASVEVAKTRLVAYYTSLGAKLQTTGQGGSNAPPPPSARITKAFSCEQVKADLEMSSAIVWKRANANPKCKVRTLTIFSSCAVMIYVARILHRKC